MKVERNAQTMKYSWYYLLMGFASSWYKKESAAHPSAFFLMRQLSASELISGEEEMEVSQVVRTDFKLVGRSNGTALSTFLEELP